LPSGATASAFGAQPASCTVLEPRLSRPLPALTASTSTLLSWLLVANANVPAGFIASALDGIAGLHCLSAKRAAI
jgi:hypothetical protein